MGAGDYIEADVGAGFIVLTSMAPFYPRKIANGSIESSFKSIHPALGTMDDFSALLRAFKKRGMETVITLNFNAVPVNHELAKSSFLVKSVGAEEV